MDKITAELTRLRNAARWSWAGWRAAWASEVSLRQWGRLNLASAALTLLVEMTAAERALILALGLLILAAELVNTAVEEAVDYISTERDPRAKKAKDCASAAVTVVAFAAGVAWAAVLLG